MAVVCEQCCGNMVLPDGSPCPWCDGQGIRRESPCPAEETSHPSRPHYVGKRIHWLTIESRCYCTGMKWRSERNLQVTACGGCGDFFEVRVRLHEECPE